MKDLWICHKCGKMTDEYPALSRRDNQTEICSECGAIEAMEDFEKYYKSKAK